MCIAFYQADRFPLLKILDTLLPADFSVIPKFSTFLHYVWGLAGAAGLATGAAFLGGVALNKWRERPLLPVEFAVLSTAVGFGILAYLTLLIGKMGWLYPVGIRLGVAALTAVGVVWFYRSGAGRVWGAAWTTLKSSLFPGGLGSILGVLLVFLLATDVVLAFVPELFYDALVYHLGVPNYYLSEHRIQTLPIMHSKFPFTVQMIYTLGLALKDEMVTKLTHLAFLILLIGGFAAFGQRRGRPRIGVLAGLAFASIPTVQLNVWTSGIDMGVSLFGLFAAISFLTALENNDDFSFWFFLSAVFAGLTAASKYTAAYVPATIGLAYLVWALAARRPIVWILRMGFVYAAIVVAAVAPWLIKNWFETGNPVYPFLASAFGGESIAPWRYAILKAENAGLTPNSLWEGIRLFWDLSVNERSSLSFQGPLLLACVPFVPALFLKDRERWVWTLGIYGLIFCVLGLSMTRLTRYLLPGITVIALIVAAGVERMMSDKNFFYRFSVFSVFFLGAFLQISIVYRLIADPIQPQKVLLGRESRLEFMDRYHSGMNPYPSTRMYKYMEENFLKTDKVLLVGEEKAYPIKVRHLYSGVYDTGPLVRFCNQSENPKEVAEKLSSIGITHIMINITEAHRIAGYGIFGWTPAGFGVFGSFWQNHLQLQKVEEWNSTTVDNSNAILLFKIIQDPAAKTSPPIQNVVGPIYEKVEFPRLNITTNEQKAAFYQDRIREWPQVYYFLGRLQQLRANPKQNE